MNHEMNVAVQTYNNRENSPRCLSCAKTIINPLCPYCLTRHFKAWVSQYPNLEKQTLDKLENCIEKSKEKIGEDCAICNKKVHTCVYCTTEYMYSLLKEAGSGPRILAEFLFIFNYDFKKIGYIHDLEALGWY